MLEIHTAKPLPLDPIPFEVEIAIAKLKCTNRHVVIKSGRTDSIRR
jgi:hypothetical protein